MEINITDKTFEKEVIKKSENIPVIVDFWAEWCGPCRMLGPMISGIAKQYEKKIVLAKLNIEENREKAEEYGIMSIPNVKLFKKGEVVDEFVGVMPEQELKDFIERNI